MIKASDRIKIITEWILSSPEYNALSGLRDNIRQLIINQADSVLTDEEKKYINVYGWDKTKEQDSIDSDFFDYFNEKEKLKSIPYDSCCNNYGAATTIYDGSKLPILKELDCITIPSHTPYLFSIDRYSRYSKENRYTLENMKKLYPEFYKALKSEVRMYVSTVDKLDKKIKALADVICDKKATMTILKGNYKELFDLA